MRIAVKVGHNVKAQGAVRKDGISEWIWNCELADMIRQHDPDSVRVFLREPGAGGVRKAYAAVDAWNADVSIELHFNSVGSSQATGTETLSSGSKGSLALAEKVQEAMVGVLGLRDRGILIRTPWGKTKLERRGSTSLHAGKAPAVLIEPYFGSNPGDCATADRNKQALACAIYNAARAVG
jgi:N-acetylmuramoyl-L-alanine amidase